MKIIIIGGVAAGMSSASKAKRQDPSSTITVYEKGATLSYGACGLPYFVSGDNDDINRMIMRTASDFESAGIQVRLHHEVLKVNVEDETIMVKDLQTGRIFLDPYDKLMIATGASPLVPPLPGIAGYPMGQGLYVLKDLEDGQSLKRAMANPKVRRVVIVGGGYIGLELAEAAVTQNKEVTVIEAAPHILRSFDVDMLDLAYDALKRHGVALKLGHRLEAILRDGNGHVSGVQTDGGNLDCDLVVLAIGVKPNTAFLKGSGIKSAPNGALEIDREMRTNIPNVYAAGDCARVYHAIKEENDYIPLGTTANKCGRIAGTNLVGGREKFAGTLGSAAIKILDIEMGRTGLSEAEAQASGLAYKTQGVLTYDHPGYYPNSQPIYIKLIYAPRTLRLLGAQAVGQMGTGAVLRINSLAIAITSGMTCDDLGQVDLAYAPPFTGVWDAIHIAANAVKP